LLQTPGPNFQSWRGKLIKKFLLEDLATTIFCVKLLEEPNPNGCYFETLDLFNAMSRRFTSASAITNELMLNIPVQKPFQQLMV